jgi:hypothetical protein
MYPVSEAFRNAIVGCDQLAVVKVSVTLDDSALGELTIVSGQVDCDGTRDGALRSLSLTAAPHPDAFAWLTTMGSEIVVSRGLVLADGTQELVPMGVFLLDADLDEAEDGTIVFSAADRSQRISRTRWTDPYTIQRGTSVGDAIAQVLSTCWPDCPLGETLATIGKTTGAKLTYLDGADSDPWKDARALAASSGHDLHFDADGVVQVRDAPDPAVDPVCAYYYAAESIIVGQSRKAVISQMYNGVIATAEGSDVATPKRGEAWDEDPASPTYCYGPMGRVPLFYSSPLLNSQDDVDSAAETMLARVKRPLEQIVFRLVPNPAHEAFDVVEFVDLAGAARRYMIDVVSTPLDVSGPMTATMRETDVD